MPFPRHIENLIADLRELPCDHSWSKSRAPRPLTELVNKLQRTHNLNGEGRLEEVIMRHWKEIVGTERAHRCAPERIVNESCLVIYVGNATLRMELQFDKRILIKRLQQIPGCEALQEVRFQ